MRRLLEHVRYLVVVAVAGLTVTMTVTFAWAIANTIRLIGTLLDGGWRSDLTMVDLLEVIDTYLLAIVQLIVVIGIYTGAIAILIAALSLFRLKPTRYEPPPPTAAVSPAPHGDHPLPPA